MIDQARQLRQLVRRQSSCARDDRSARPKLVAVTGGKGGVGATTVALDLAVALTRQGHRTALVDADPQGVAAIRCLLRERYTLADVLSGQCTVREALHAGPAGVLILPAAWGWADPWECGDFAQDRLTDQLHDLSDLVDCLVVDTGNGPAPMVRRFWPAADLILIVTTPEPDSVLAAYSLIKLQARGDDRLPIHTLVTKAFDPGLAEETHARLACVCRRFLGIPLGHAGHLAPRRGAGESAQTEQLVERLVKVGGIARGEMHSVSVAPDKRGGN